MKKIFLFLTCLAMGSLACLQSATVSGEQLSVIGDQAGGTAEVAAAVTEIETEIVMDEKSVLLCAKVIANEALHLRGGAGADRQVIAYLKHDQALRVINRDDPDWWKVSDGFLVGYARSVYLEIVECE